MKNSIITIYEKQNDEWIERNVNLNDIPDCTAKDFESVKHFCDWANGISGKCLDDDGAFWVEPLD